MSEEYVKDENIYKLLKSLTKQTVDTLCECNLDEAFQTQNVRWTVDNENRFQKQIIEQPFISSLVYKVYSTIRISEEYQCLERLMKEDIFFSRYIDKMVGTNLELFKIDMEVIFLLFVNNFTTIDSIKSFNELKFEEIYSNLEYEINRDFINYSIFFPIYGFSSVEEIIKFSDSISINKFSNDDISYLLEKGILQNEFIMNCTDTVIT